MEHHRDDFLEQARLKAELTLAELWLRYFALGGDLGALELEAICFGLMAPTTADSNRIALALNERFAELGMDQPLRYVDGEP